MSVSPPSVVAYARTEENVFVFEQQSVAFNEQKSLLFEREVELDDWAASGGCGDELEIRCVYDRLQSSRRWLERTRQNLLGEGDRLEEITRTRVRELQESLEDHNEAVHLQRDGGSWSTYFLRNIVQLGQEREAIQKDIQRWERLLARVLTSLRVCRRQ